MEKVVLFLGAGFSAPFGLPVMNDFFRHASNSSGLITEEEKEFLRGLQQETQRGMSMLAGSHVNLEHVLSFALMTGGDDRPDEKLKSILQRIYSRIDQEAAKSLQKKLRSLLGREKRRLDYELTVITTNYDLAAEFALASIGLHPYLPFEWENWKEQGTTGSPMYVGKSDGLPTLCKLHGSLNWFAAEEKLVIEPDIVQVHGPDRPQLTTVREPVWRLPRMSAGDYFKKNETPPPLIIPPTLYKQDAPELFRSIQETAHDAIHHADRFTFIGYSFPPSDTHMKYFIASALVGNVDLARIDIVDPKAASIVGRLRDTGFGLGETFKGWLHPVPDHWHTSSYNLMRP